MGEYIGYVWTAYGLALSILGAVVIATVMKNRKLKKEEENLKHKKAL